MSMTATAIQPKAANLDFLPLQGTEYVEFYVGNARQAAHFYRTAFGFQPLAYAGPETGVRDRASYVIRQHKLTFVFTTPLSGRGRPRWRSTSRLHGDGVKVLTHALRVWTTPDHSAWRETTRRGARRDDPIWNPPATTTIRDPLSSPVSTRTETRFTLCSVERGAYTGGAFLPGLCTLVDPPLPDDGHGSSIRRPLCRQRGLESNEHLGQILRRRDGLPQHPVLRRRGHLHRVLGPDE